MTLRGRPVRVEETRDRLNGQLATMTETGVLRQYLAEPGSLRKRWSKLTVDQRRTIIAELLNALGERIVVDPAKAGVALEDRIRQEFIR